MSADIRTEMPGAPTFPVKLQGPLGEQDYTEWVASLKDSDGAWRAGFRAPVVTDVVDVTYRQLDYWDRRGVLVPEVEAAGSGTQRVYSFEDMCLAALVGRLVRSVGEQGGWGHSLETAAVAVSRIRLAGQQVCLSAGVVAPSPNYDGPLVFPDEVPTSLTEHGFIVLSHDDMVGIAQRAMSRVVSLTEPL